MAKSAVPSLIPAFLALALIILFGYLIYSDLKSSRIEHTLPTIEIIDPPEDLPLTVIEEPLETAEIAEEVKQEAKLFVEQLSPETESTLAIKEGDDQFVGYDNVLSLPNIEQRDTTLAALLEDKNLTADMPVTLDFDVEKRTETTLARIQNKTEDFTAPITIIAPDGQMITQPLADMISQSIAGLNDPITYVEQEHRHIDTTIGELLTLDIAPDFPLQASITLGVQDIAVSDLVNGNGNTNGLYYVHRVTDKDKQGLWGIIQTGLIEKFRHGLRIEGIQKNKELAQAVIPEDADEKLESGLSSFLGNILNRKVDNSYIYNYQTKVMGRDANLIHPGQQVILVEFNPNELTDIYQFFSDKRNQGIETFAITD